MIGLKSIYHVARNSHTGREAQGGAEAEGDVFGTFVLSDLLLNDCTHECSFFASPILSTYALLAATPP